MGPNTCPKNFVWSFLVGHWFANTSINLGRAALLEFPKSCELARVLAHMVCLAVLKLLYELSFKLRGCEFVYFRYGAWSRAYTAAFGLRVADSVEKHKQDHVFHAALLVQSVVRVGLGVFHDLVIPGRTQCRIPLKSWRSIVKRLIRNYSWSCTARILALRSWVIFGWMCHDTSLNYVC